MSELAVGSLKGLAANDFVIDVAAGSTLNVPPPAILQVVSTTKTDTFVESVVTGGLSGDVTGLTVSITPSSTSSKILVTGFIATDTDATNGFQLLRDGTAVGQADAASNRARLHSAITVFGGLTGNGSGAMNFLDSLSSTSSLTYSVRLFNNGAGTKTLFLNRSTTDSDTSRSSRNVSTITLMEVAG